MSPTRCKSTYRRYPFPPRPLRMQAFSAILQQANQALKDYSSLLIQVPSPQFLLSSLMALEAIASLESRELKTSPKNLFQFIQSPSSEKDPQIIPILHYLQALEWASKNGKRSLFSKATICAIHKKVKQGSTSKADIGIYRNRQNWIGPAGCTMEEAYFYPPAANQIEVLMRELFHFAKKKEKEPLLQLALIFSQLLGIHPFMDGNGRVARILIPLFLVYKNVIPTPHFFLSSYFKRHRLQYFRGLYQTTEENKWQAWIIFFLKGVIIETKKSHRIVQKILALYNQILSEKIPSLDHKTLLFLFQNPIFPKDAIHSNSLLETLLQKKWIKKDGKNLFSFVALLKILTRA